MLKDKRWFLKTLAILLVFTIYSVFASGGRRNATAGAQQLLIPVGAQGIAVGGAYVAGLTGIESIYYNPAGLSGLTNSAEVAFSQMSWIADIDFSYAAVAVNMGGLGHIGVTLRSLDFGDIPVTTVERPQGTGYTFSPSYITLGLTYANFLTDRIKAGVSFNIISEEIERTGGTGFTVDVGLQYDGLAQIEGLQMGIVLKNFGPAMTYDGPDLYRTADDGSNRGRQDLKIQAEGFEMPSQLELGLAYKATIDEMFTGIISSSFQNNNFANDQYKFGGEVAYDDMFFLRAGYSYAEDRSGLNGDDNIFGPSFGAGFKFSGELDVTIDYAFRYVDIFDDNQVFAVKIAF
jgi:hypothetical protein